MINSSTFLVSWFAGSHEGASDSTIHAFRSAGSQTGIVSIAPLDNLPHWNPVLAAGLDGRIWLFFKRGWRIDMWTTWVSHSEDAGLSWTAPREMVPGDLSGGRGPVRQAPIRMRNHWVAPGSVEVWDPPQWDCFMDISSDDGQTWERVGLPLDHASVRGAGCIQPCLVSLSDGTLIALTRSTAGSVFRSATNDPYVWPPLEPVSLPNGNSGLAAIGLPDGRIVSCHNAAPDDWGARSTLVLSESCDRGLTWGRKQVVAGASGSSIDDEVLDLDGRPARVAPTGIITSGDGEYSYPSLALVGSELWLTYTWQRRSIAMVRIKW